MWVPATVGRVCMGVRGACEGVCVGGTWLWVSGSVGSVCMGVCVGCAWVLVFWGVKDVGCEHAGVCSGGIVRSACGC